MGRHAAYAVRQEDEVDEKPQAGDNDLLTVREVARRLRVDDTTCRRWIKQGSLPAVSLPHTGKRQAYRIRRRDLDKILEGDAEVA